jgi:hypothetical protein
MIYATIGLSLIVLFLCLYIAKLQGYRISRVAPQTLSEREKQEQERKIREFDEVMNYSLAQALGRKRVG